MKIGTGRRSAALAAVLVVVLAGCRGVTPADPSSGSDATAPGTTRAPAPPSSPPPSGSTPSSTISSPSGSPSRSSAAVAGTAPAPQPKVALPPAAGSEISGIAAGADPGVLLVADDGAGPQPVTAVRPDGTSLATVTLDGVDASNIEALAGAPCGAGAAERCLYIGDIGEARSTVTVYRAPMPSAPQWRAAAEAWTYRYPAGPDGVRRRNAEALLIAPNGDVLIIDKPATAGGKVLPHRVFRGARGGGELQLAGSFTPPRPTVPLQSLVTGTVVTDAYYGAGTPAMPARVLLLTYDQVLQYTAPGPGADPAEFYRWPVRRLSMPDADQAEGITGLDDGCGYVVASEAGPLAQSSTLATVSCAETKEPP
ncbi:hypothetical protein [Nakamurella aerolata]|uniref:Lipoprotein n=1 Tax=Nakamurella aerolata TaxID=1656892 RepID=A0A849A735_9ACTN|nr:hypothetical protein [Nakamurella aerolata]NNG34841.1 hypothetical protein [Nakamurella aerolata]